MLSPTKDPDSTPLDRSRVSSLIADISKHQQKLVKSLPTKMHIQTSLSMKEYSTLGKKKTEIEQLSRTLQSLVERAEKNQPENSTSEWQAVLNALHEADETSRVLGLFVAVCQKTEACESASKLSNLAKLAQDLADLKRHLNDLGKEERYGLRVISSLKARRMEMQSSLVSTLEKEWRKLFRIQIFSVAPEEPAGKIATMTLGFFSEPQEEPLGVDDKKIQEKLADLINCAKFLKMQERLTKEFCEILSANFISELANGNAVVSTDTNDHFPRLSLLAIESTAIESARYGPLVELVNFFQFFREYIFVDNFDVGKQFAATMGIFLNGVLLELVRNQCIKKRLPNSFEDFLSEKPMFLTHYHHLSEILLKIGIVNKTELNSWDITTEDLQNLYIQKRSGNLLISARRLCLSESLNIPVQHKSVNEASLVETDEFSLFCLQDMVISHTMSSLGEKSQRLLEDCLRLPSGVSFSIAIYNSFVLYLDLVPLHLQDQLQNVPTVGALFFTSCIYASFRLYLFNRMIQSAMNSLEADDPGWNISFADLIVKFRIRGYEIINGMVERFSKEVLEAVHGEEVIWMSKIAQTQIQALLQKSTLRRGMDLLSRLAGTWRTILPPSVFQQSVGQIIDNILQNFITRVLAVEDINATDSADLCENFRWFLEQCEETLKVAQLDYVEPAIFQNVASWLRFREVIFVLDSSMSQIADRWVDGSGPLTEHLSADELKKMVRALFENNDKRARLLNIIK